MYVAIVFFILQWRFLKKTEEKFSCIKTSSITLVFDFSRVKPEKLKLYSTKYNIN